MAENNPDLRYTSSRGCETCTSNPGEASQFDLKFRLHGTVFSISVSLSQFHSSPSRTKDFHQCWQSLHSDDVIETEDDLETVESGHEAQSRNTTVDGLDWEDAFDWAVTPFLSTFLKLAPCPENTSNVTLQQYFNSPAYKCELSAVDDELVAGPVTLVLPDDFTYELYPGYEAPSWSTEARIFHPSDVEIVTQDPQKVFDDEPRRVLVDGKEYHFKSFQGDGQAGPREVVEKLEKIGRANFPVNIRTSRMFGVVQSDKHELMGVLLYLIDEDELLPEALFDSETPPATKNKWAKQIQETLAALHGAGVVWGNASPFNIIIDTQGDAWLVGFGQGYTVGWVDGDKAGTMEGDLQGLGKILDFITTGEKPSHH